MKKIFYLLLLFATSFTISAQTTAEYNQLVSRYEQWKAAQYKTGAYATPGNCKMDIVTKEGYKGPVAGIPKDITIHYSDINGDGKLDALVTFNPLQCDGGNAMMNAQARVLIVSKGTVWHTDDKYITSIERNKDGWFSVSGVSGGTIFGTYYEYTADDGRCCPSIRKPFTIDYKTKQLNIDND